MSLFFLAFRNILRSFDKRWPLVVILAACALILSLGNALFESVSSGLERTYVSSLSGNISVSAQGNEPFTLLGNELPLIGEYAVLPVLPNANSLVEMARKRGLSPVGQVTSGGIIGWANSSIKAVLFGVDFGPYFSTFPSLKIVSQIPQRSGGEIYLNSVQFEQLSHLDPPVRLGDVLSVSVFNDHSFTIRPVRVVGVFEYPVSDETLDRVALVDPDTARALNGYVIGNHPEKAQTDVGVVSESIDDLFSGVADTQSRSSEGLTPDQVAASLENSSERKQLNQTDRGAWNFVLAKGNQRQVSEFRADLRAEKSLQVRDWRGTVGGKAQLVGLIQILFNVGLLFVVLGVTMVSINSLSLSVVERTSEWGTIRALGGTRSVVSRLVLFESLVVVGGSGLLGILVAAIFSVLSHDPGFAITNDYLRSLFGASRWHPLLTASATLEVAVFSLALGVLAALSPIRRVLRISPQEAMGRE